MSNAISLTLGNGINCRPTRLLSCFLAATSRGLVRTGFNSATPPILPTTLEISKSLKSSSRLWYLISSSNKHFILKLVSLPDRNVKLSNKVEIIKTTGGLQTNGVASAIKWQRWRLLIPPKQNSYPRYPKSAFTLPPPQTVYTTIITIINIF